MILSSEFVVIVLLEELGVDYLRLFTGLKPVKFSWHRPEGDTLTN